MGSTKSINVFMSKKTHESMEQNYIATSYSLNLSFFCHHIYHNYQFEEKVSEAQFRTEYFCCLPDLKVLEIIHATATEDLNFKSILLL